MSEQLTETEIMNLVEEYSTQLRNMASTSQGKVENTKP